MDKIEIFRLILVPIVGGLIFIAKKVFDEWFKDRRRWQSPETEEYRKMLDGKFLDEGVRNLLVRRYNIDAFYIATGTRAFTYEEIPSMVALLNRKESLISDRTLRMIYPKFLRFEGDRPSIHISVSDKIENAVLRFFEMYLIGAFALGFWYAFDKDFLRIATMAGAGAVLIAGLVGLQIVQLPYRRARKLAKIINDGGS
ncbi:hypothetical protein [Brucella anthropi]|uniref:hypothetical protein n=1 Tax=Brucella anthropi TaxID=529 RepID=UPI0012676A9D|nr:hypothetical protein [Brucella anthropi]